MTIATNLSAEILHNILQSFLRDELHSFYVYHPLARLSEGEEQWLIVVSSLSLLHDIRVLLRANSADFPPISVATPALLELYCRTNPIFAEQLGQGTRIGVALSVDLTIPASAELHCAFLAHLWLQISPLLTTVNSADSFEEIESVYRKLAHLLSLPAITPPLELLATMQKRCPPPVVLPVPTSPISRSLPTLRLIYDDLESVLLVVDDAVEALRGINWIEVLAEHGRRAERLQLITMTQLDLIVMYELPLAFGIGRYRLRDSDHSFVAQPLPFSLLQQNAQRILLELLIDYLPKRYLSSADDELPLLIHDLQNQLLKIQLQYDLLCMLYPLQRHAMPRFNHARQRSSIMRISDILKHIEQWIAVYA